MAEITAAMVKDLREKTGAGMMDCKKALSENGGDFAKAEDWLRLKGISKAASKGARIAAEGLVAVTVAADARTGVVVEVNSETDFVARNPDFKRLTEQVAELVAKAGPADVPALLASPMNGKTVKDVVTEAVAKIGENLSIRRFSRFVAEGPSVIGSYLHGDGKLGVLVELGAGNAAAAENPEVQALARELALQVAGAFSQYVSRDQVPADVLAREQDIFKEELRQAKKPEAIWEKILTGKLEKYFEQICLVDQLWVKDDKKKMKALIAETSKKVGAELTVRRFARLKVGEGIEKRKEDLAAEVAKTLGSR